MTEQAGRNRAADARQGWFEVGFAAVVALLLASLFSWPLAHAPHLMACAQDDFYYYLRVAGNLAHGHGSTFDGSTRTNGYHPLYLLLWVAVSRFVTGLPGVFRVLWALDVASAMAVFLLCRRLLSRHGAARWLAASLAVLLTVYDVRLLCQQMEVTLTVPLALGVLALADLEPHRLRAGRMLGLGLLSALTILSRLDSAILLMLFFLALLSRPAYRRALTPAGIVSFCLGLGVPLAAYLAVNRIVFHTLLPVSGMAKQMRSTWVPSLTALRSCSGLAGGIMGLTLAVLLLYALLPGLRRRLTSFEQALVPPCLFFAPLHLAVLSVLSDWQEWGWYWYGLRFAMLATAILLVRMVGARWAERDGPVTWAAAALALGVLAASSYQVDPTMIAIESSAHELAAFARTHPGRYAMGDRAGMFGYLSPEPVLQVEGLMADRALVEHIRRQEDLGQVLRLYHVDFYVSSAETTDAQGCVLATEPAQAGPSAPHLHGRFCQKPVAVFHDPGWTNAIYRLDAAPRPRRSSVRIQPDAVIGLQDVSSDGLRVLPLLVH